MVIMVIIVISKETGKGSFEMEGLARQRAVFSRLTSPSTAVTFFLLLIRFARPPRLEEDWEAGANPALPRNCKRGHRTGPLENFPGRPEARLNK
jgi:hypothetical protein